MFADKMRNPFKKKLSYGSIERFSGVGTVQTISISNIDELFENLKPENMITLLKEYLGHVLPIIKKYSGVTIRYEAHDVLAVWPPYHRNPSHAQLAFDASREILLTWPDFVTNDGLKTCDMGIVLGSGEIIGDLFGPKKQFQIVGEAMAIIDHLSKSKNINGSFILMSQCTTELLVNTEGFEEIKSIQRDNLDNLRVIAYRPVEMGSGRGKYLIYK